MKAWLSMDVVKVVSKVRIQDFPKNKLVRRHGDYLGTVEEFRISLMFQVWVMERRVVPLTEKKMIAGTIERQKKIQVNRRHEKRNRYIDLEVIIISSTIIEYLISSRHCTCT